MANTFMAEYVDFTMFTTDQVSPVIGAAVEVPAMAVDLGQVAVAGAWMGLGGDPYEPHWLSDFAHHAPLLADQEKTRQYLIDKELENLRDGVIALGLFGAGKVGGKVLNKILGKGTALLPEAVAEGELSTASNSAARFRGNPFAFGTEPRDARVSALLDEASRASGVRLEDLVDEVRYVQGSSNFDVVNGKRVLSVGSDAFGKTYAGQLIEGAHEIGHAQVFDKLVIH